MPTPTDLLGLLHEVRRRLGGDVSLDALAARAGWSPFHLHRAFRALVGETPKQYTQRLRLDRAAARLATSADRVVDVALESGFASHEVFARAFRRRFGRSPESYRAAMREAAPVAARARHAEATVGAGPCLSLYHLSLDATPRSSFMATPTVTRKDLQPQPALVVRRRIARAEIPTTIAECLGKAFTHGQQAGLALSGRPFSRYSDVGPGLMTIECGIPLAAPGSGAGEVEAVTLPGGPAAFAVHMGSYDKLQDTYAAMERWIDDTGARIAGPPWESYITDPVEYPDPADWKTEIYWPLEK